MRQHQNFAIIRLRAGQLELSTQVMAEASAWQCLHVDGSFQAVRQKIHEAVHRLRLIAGRFAAGQLANECDDGGLLSLRKSKKRMHCLL